MSGTFLYLKYDGSWSVNLGTSAVRLGAIPGFTEIAELGAVGSSTLEIDDPTATAGHSSDGFLPFQQFQYAESAAASSVVFRGWTKGTSYARAPGTSLITGAARRITLTLEDANTLAGRRLLPPAATDATVKRPSETCAARIAWLLGTAYFSGVADNGLVHPGSGTLNANDYSGSHPADVLNDVCTLTGDNWFVYWDRTAAAWSLAVFNMTTYDGYTGSLLLSNDNAIIDSGRDGTFTAGPTNCWAVDEDATLVRSGDRITTGIYYAYAKGTVYDVGTSTTYPRIDLVASSTAVKTSGQATTKADRYLAENDEPADRITCRARIGKANVNDALAGQLISAKFTHFPPYDVLSYFRIARRTVAQAELTDQFYTVEYELVPAAPAFAVYSYAELQIPGENISGVGGGTIMIQWDQDGDCSNGAVGCWEHNPLTGPLAYSNAGVGVGHYKTGLEVTGTGNVDVVLSRIDWNVLVFAPSQTMTIEIRKNGVAIASHTETEAGTGGFPRAWADHVSDLHADNVAVVPGDVFTIQGTWTFTMGGYFNSITTGVPFHVSGYLVP